MDFVNLLLLILLRIVVTLRFAVTTIGLLGVGWLLTFGPFVGVLLGLVVPLVGLWLAICGALGFWWD